MIENLYVSWFSFSLAKFLLTRGYVSQPLATKLLQDFGIQFFAKPRRNMRSRHGRETRPCATC